MELQACDPEDSALYGARQALVQRGKYLFLVFDEIECIWTKEDKLRDEAFHLLLVLGNSGGGSTSTVVCGSTASLHRLITGYPVPPLHTARRGSLNETKYRVTWLPGDSPADETATARIVNTLLPPTLTMTPGQRRALVEFVHFVAGSNPRAVEQILSATSAASAIANMEALQVWGGLFNAGCGKMRLSAYGHRSELYLAIPRFFMLSLQVMLFPQNGSIDVPPGGERIVDAIIAALLAENAELVAGWESAFRNKVCRTEWLRMGEMHVGIHFCLIVLILLSLYIPPPTHPPPPPPPQTHLHLG